MKTQFEIGQTIDAHESYESANQCFVCGKEIKESNIELKIAMTDNRTLISANEIESLNYGSDWSPKIGKTCVKKFPKESILEEINI